MNLNFSSFADAGDLQKERLVLKAKAAIPLGDYLVMASKASATGTAVAGRHRAYWFPDGDVEADDLVVVYTKSGVDSKKKLASGATAHFFYWGLETPLWGKMSGNGVVILRADSWLFHVAAPKADT
jgi:hypothetical protein